MARRRSAALPAPIAEFIDHLWLVENLADATTASYRSDLLIFHDWLIRNSEDLLKVRPQTFERWQAFRYERGISAKTVARDLIVLKRFYGFLRKRGQIEDDPTLNLVIPCITRGIPVVPSSSEMNELLDIVNLNSLTGLRDKSMLELLYATGLRASELAELEMNDLDHRNRAIRVLGKGERERVVIYGEEAAFWLDLYVSRARPGLRQHHYRESRVFLSKRGKPLRVETICKIVKSHAELNRIACRITTHSVRHAFATHLLDAGADIRSIQLLLGHACISTTQIYTQVTTRKKLSIHRDRHPRNQKKCTKSA